MDRVEWYGILAASALGGASNGFNSALTNGLVPRLSSELNLSDTEEGLLGSSLFAGGLVGAIAGITMNDVYGRRLTTIVGETIIIVGTIAQLSLLNVYSVSIARTVTGLGFGLCAVTKPLYVAELSASQRRGFAVALFSVFFSLGLNLVFLLENVLPEAGKEVNGLEAQAWRLEIALSGLPAVALLVVVMTMLPESPVFLHRGEKCTSESDELIPGVDASKESAALSRAILIVVMLSFVHQLTLIAPIMGYTAEILERLGVPHEYASSCAIANSASHLLGVVVGLFTVDIFGRRNLLFPGIAIMILSSATIFVAEIARGHSTTTTTWVLELIMLCMFTIGFQLGPATVTFVLFNELFPLRHRSLGNGLGISLIFLWCMTIMTVYPSIINTTSISNLMVWIMAVLLTSGAVLRFMLPETKGVKIDRITKMWSRFLAGKKPYVD